MSQSDELAQPADTMRERTGESRAKTWFLITANRWIVTTFFSLAMFAFFVLFEILGPSNIRALLTPQSINSAFGSVIIAIVTGVSLILAIAQLVLSQQMDTLGDKNEEMGKQVEFKTTVEEKADDDVSPAVPSEFLQLLIEIVGVRASTLKDAVKSDSGDDLPLVEYADGLIDHGKTVEEQLDDAEFGSFEVLGAVLNFNYSWKIFAGRQLRAEHADSIPDEAEEAFDEMLEVLRLFAPAREYFKTLYFQWEIMNLSRATLYSSIPSLAAAAYMIFAFDPNGISGVTLGVDNLYLVAGGIYTLSLLPFVMVLAYVLRFVTVLKRTLSIGPFILRESKRSEDES